MILIDVRTREEFDASHAIGATNIPPGSINDSNLLPSNYEVEIGVYCRSGSRSSIASAELAALGYTNVLNIGGLNDAIDLVGEE
ncbi:MAG: phage shock protein E [Candidatus Saccharimonadales bacterium]|jgi:phage shock protein E